MALLLPVLATLAGNPLLPLFLPMASVGLGLTGVATLIVATAILSQKGGEDWEVDKPLFTSRYTSFFIFYSNVGVRKGRGSCRCNKGG
jgi:hypothetical protein